MSNQELTEETIKLLQDARNVCIDKRSGLYTMGDPGDQYGWMPIPQSWLKAVE